MWFVIAMTALFAMLMLCFTVGVISGLVLEKCFQQCFNRRVKKNKYEKCEKPEEESLGHEGKCISGLSTANQAQAVRTTDWAGLPEAIFLTQKGSHYHLFEGCRAIKGSGHGIKKLYMCVATA